MRRLVGESGKFRRFFSTRLSIAAQRCRAVHVARFWLTRVNIVGRSNLTVPVGRRFFCFPEGPVTILSLLCCVDPKTTPVFFRVYFCVYVDDVKSFTPAGVGVLAFRMLWVFTGHVFLRFFRVCYAG